MTTFAGCALQDAIPLKIAPMNTANSIPRIVLIVANRVRFSASPYSERTF